MAESVNRRPDALTLAAFIATIILAGANGTAISFSNRELDPFWGATLRFLPATCIFLAIALAMKRKFPRGPALVGALIYGVLGFGATFAFVYWALLSIGPGLAQVVLAMGPLMTLVLVVMHGQERFRWQALVGALVSLVGIAFVFQGQVRGEFPLVGLLALVAATLCAAESSIAVKHFPKADIVTTNVVAMAAAAVMLFLLSILFNESWTIPRLPSTWIAVGFLVIVGSVVVFALSLFVLQRWTASAVAYQWVLLPLVAVPVSAVFTGEDITGGLLLGGVLVLAGVYVGAIWRSRAGAASGKKHGRE